MQAIDRQSVDLTDYPDLVMIMLGFRVRGWRGLLAMRQIGPGLARIGRDRPDGLLAHEGMLFSLTHFGFRQYWRDLASLERFTRSEPHAEWWRRVRELSSSAGFWHELIMPGVALKHSTSGWGAQSDCNGSLQHFRRSDRS